MWMPGPRRGFYAMRVIKVNPQLVDGVVGNQRQLFRAVFPRNIMLLQQGKQLLRIAPVDQRVKEYAVVEQIVNLGSTHIVRGLRARIGHFRIKNAAHRPPVAFLVEQLHHFRRCQHFVMVPLHPGAGVLLVRPAQGVEIDARLHHNRLVEGEPARNFAVVACEHLFGVAHKQFDHLL
ncbi:hypothetical protein D3C87_1453140 [compost metagenome]